MNIVKKTAFSVLLMVMACSTPLLATAKDTYVTFEITNQTSRPITLTRSDTPYFNPESDNAPIYPDERRVYKVVYPTLPDYYPPHSPDDADGPVNPVLRQTLTFSSGNHHCVFVTGLEVFLRFLNPPASRPEAADYAVTPIRLLGANSTGSMDVQCTGRLSQVNRKTPFDYHVHFVMRD